jgi:hypothetical protein
VKSLNSGVLVCFGILIWSVLLTAMLLLQPDLNTDSDGCGTFLVYLTLGWGFVLMVIGSNRIIMGPENYDGLCKEPTNEL